MENAVSDSKSFESAASEPVSTTALSKELQDFVTKSQLVTVTPAVADPSVVEPDMTYLLAWEGYGLVIKG